MKIGLVGSSSQQRSLPFNAERTINLIPEVDQNGKEVAALYGTPGLLEFSECASGVIRGMFAAANGRAFVVCGNGLYEIDSAGTATSRGTLNSSLSICTIDENGLALGICDGTDVYTFTYASNTFADVTDVDLPSASGTLTFIDGYFVVNEVDTGKFYISGLYDGSAWDSLDFATAESSPDILVRVINAVGQLWLFGAKTTEIWTNTGDSAFPFERISGAKMEMGIIGEHTAVAVDNSVMWVGRDNIGQGIVYRANGFTPQRVSTTAIEVKLRGVTDPEDLKAYTYQMDGHVYYVLSGGGLETTLVYDLTTQSWHERAYLRNGELSNHLGQHHMFAFGKTLVGGNQSAKIYDMSFDYYDDDGDEILRQRIYTHIADEGKRIRFNALEIGFEVGVGLQTGQGSAPLCTLYISKDGGRTWSDGHQASIGAAGQTQAKVAFRRLGIAEQMTFKLEITDPVKVAITGSYLT